MSANKNGKAPEKASVKRMRRPERLEALMRGETKVTAFWMRRGIYVR